MTNEQTPILPFKPRQEKPTVATLVPGTKGFMACTCPNQEYGWGPLLNIGTDGVPFIEALICIGCGREVFITDGKLPQPHQVIIPSKGGNDNGERT